MFGKKKTTKNAKPDPRPIASTRCLDSGAGLGTGCGAGPNTNPAGDPHEWSCELVPHAMYVEYFDLPVTQP